MGSVLKYIPDEVSHHYNVIDPKVKWLPDHGLSSEDFKPVKRDVTRKKSHQEIKRIPDHKIDMEFIPQDEHIIREHHIDSAEKEH